MNTPALHRPLPVRLAAAIGLLIASTARAEPPQTPAAEPPTATMTAGAVELAETPIDVPGLNLTVRLPIGAVAESTGVGLDSKLSVKSSDDPKLNKWLLQAFASVTRDTGLTTAGVLDSIAQQRQAGQLAINPKTRRRMTVRQFDRDDKLIINGQPAARMYLDVPEDANHRVSGYTVFNPTPGTFVLFQFDCPVGNFAEARPVIETAIATTQFRDQQIETALRKQGIAAAGEFLSSLTAEELDGALMAEPALFRVFKPGAGPGGGDLDIGYQKITLRKGQLGEVANTDKLKWSRDDREFGYFARIEARGLVFAPGDDGSSEPQAVIDSVSSFWLSSDRANETGSVVNAVKRGANADTYVQTIVRRGDRLTVKTNAPGQDPRVQDYDKLPAGYISRVELMLMPRLVVARGQPARFNFYSFDFTAAKLSMRRDELEAAAPGQGLPDNSWLWISQPYEAQLDRVVNATLDPRGMLIRREADATTTEPIGPDELRALWESKKLPIEAGK